MIITEWEAFTLQLPALLAWWERERGWGSDGDTWYNSNTWEVINITTPGYGRHWPSHYHSCSALNNVPHNWSQSLLCWSGWRWWRWWRRVPSRCWWRCTPVLPVDDLTANQMSEFCHRPMRSRELHNHTFNKWLHKIYLIYFLYI